VIERVHTFGSHRGLVGVVTEPPASAARGGAPAILFSNVGLNHRVGPGRLYVELARALAAAGFSSLRFDLSGFGDSEPRRSGGTALERSVVDTREAMDFLEKRGIHTFVLLGFCSGVDSAYAAALEDPRVVGGIFIEGYSYKNFGFWIRRITVRNLQPARWRRYFRLRIPRLLRRARRDIEKVPQIFTDEHPSKEQFAADLARLVARSVRMLFIYTVVSDNHYNYRNQFHDVFGYRDEIDVEYHTRADHVFSTEDHRAHLLSRLVGWMDARFPGQPSSSRETSATPMKRA
jgi:pimeloyl-ACP methyl ester carboxylesterase